MAQKKRITAPGAQSRRKQRQVIRYTTVGAVIVAVIFFCILIVQGYEMMQIYQEQQHVQQQLEQLQQRNKELEAEKEKLSDPKYIESVARDELGLVRPGEVPYIK